MTPTGFYKPIAGHANLPGINFRKVAPYEFYKPVASHRALRGGRLERRPERSSESALESVPESGLESVLQSVPESVLECAGVWGGREIQLKCSGLGPLRGKVCEFYIRMHLMGPLNTYYD